MSPRQGVALVREESAEEVRRLYLLVPDDLTLLDTVRGDGHRLALAVQLVWARTARVLDADPASLPLAVIRAVADQLALEPEILTSYRSWSATRAADSAVISQHLGVRPFTKEDGMRLHEFLREKVAQTGNTAALLDAAEEWLLKEGILHPAGETTIDRILYGARALAEETVFAVIANQTGRGAARSIRRPLPDGGEGEPVGRVQPPTPAALPAFCCDRM